jgi:hypothetical protein
MATAVGSLLRAASRKPSEPLNILTFPTHERYEVGLAKTGHNFYAWRGPGIKDWKDIYAKRPSNYILLDPEKGDKQIPPELELDLIISQNKFGQYQVAHKLSRELHLPLLNLEHTLPMDSWLGNLNQFKQMRGEINVFISEYSRKRWGWEDDEAYVIHHGIDTDLFTPSDNSQRKLHVLSVVNDFANRDWCCGYNLWKEVTTGLPVKLLGDTPGLSEPAKSIDELVKAYQQCGVFLNTSLVSPVPTVMLEAMACGCAVVSTNTCMIPDIITHGENGLLYDNEKEMREGIELLLEDKELNAKLGAAARRTIEEKFSLNRFISDWVALLNIIKDIPYTGDAHEIMLNA